MRKHASVSVLALALFSMIVTRAGAAENVPEILRRQTQQLLDAISTGSAAVWDRYLDEDLRYVDESGKVLTKKQMLEGTKPLPEGVSGTIAATEFDVAVHGSVAVATYVSDEKEDFHGHKLHCQYRSTDTWLKTAKGWRLIAGQVLALRTDPPSVPLSATLRNEYCGQYALTPTITYEIRCNGTRSRANRPAARRRSCTPRQQTCFSRPAVRATDTCSCEAPTARSPALPSGARPGTSSGNG